MTTDGCRSGRATRRIVQDESTPSGATATPASRSKANEVLVDTAHTVDRDLLDEHVLDDVVGAGLGRLDIGQYEAYCVSLARLLLPCGSAVGYYGTRCQINVRLTSPSDRNKGSAENGRVMTTTRQLHAFTAEGTATRHHGPRTRTDCPRPVQLNGFDETTVEQIASAAGVSRRTFFRYFDTKADVLWHEFDREVDALIDAFANVSDDLDLMDAIRKVVVSVNRYRAGDVPELRQRMNLIAAVPALQASAAPHYDAWERAVSEYAARRSGLEPDSLIPLAIGRTTLAACRAAFDHWVRQADADLPRELDQALRALGCGFKSRDT